MRRPRVRHAIAVVAAAMAFSVIAPSAASARGLTPTVRPSISNGEAQGNGPSSFPAVSTDGRVVAFVSTASNLVPGDSNGVADVFVRDRSAGTTTRVSVASGGGQANGASSDPAITPDGRYVAFVSGATNLAGPDSNGVTDVFLHDRNTGTTSRVSITDGEGQGNGASSSPDLSSDGRYIAFASLASNLVTGDSNGVADVFVRDRTGGRTGRASLSSSQAHANGPSATPSISATGRYVAFATSATNLVGSDGNGVDDVVVRDRTSATTGRVSQSTGGVHGNSHSRYPDISADGRFVAFESPASTLVTGDSNGVMDVFLRDRTAGITTRVSRCSTGTQAPLASDRGSISADGRFVAFTSLSGCVSPGPTNGNRQVFVHDRLSGWTARASVSTSGVPGSATSFNPSLSPDGRYVGFQSAAGNLVPSDSNGVYDVFLRGSIPAIPASLVGGEWNEVPTTDKVVALTFDAGANAGAVPSILDTLDDTDATGTFFFTGRWVQNFPAYAETIAERYPVANHSMTHGDFTTMTDAEIRAEILDAHDIIVEATGLEPRPIFRFPLGARDERTIRVVNSLGYGNMRWTVGTMGWKGTSGGETVDRIVERVLDALRPGMCVIMHVGSHPTDGSTLDADALPRIISELRARGYSFVTLDPYFP